MSEEASEQGELICACVREGGWLERLVGGLNCLVKLGRFFLSRGML